ncbi:glycosyl hydrolase family 28-related protein [Solidesulfovibrio aerotolerans]|nr:glycosyl hydrolase family 28-related protein [Solidesulfovibrio aerotolerans]
MRTVTPRRSLAAFVLLLATLFVTTAAGSAMAATYADPIAAWDKAGLRQTPPTPVQTVSVRDYGAVGDGVRDDTTAFQRALAALASPGILSIPQGSYRITASLEMTSGKVLRGEGSSTSKLIFNLNGSSDPCIDFTTYNSKSWSNLSQSAVAGASSITVASATNFKVGDMVEIEQQNDPATMYTDPEWNQDWAQSVVGQFVKVTAKSGSTLTLDRPLRTDFKTALTARARVYSLGHDVGIEDLNLTREDSGGAVGGDIIHFKYALNCWVRRVESTWTVGSHIYAESSASIEVSDSTFKYSHDYGDGGRGYGVSLGRHVSDCLIQNNVFDTLRHAMVVSQGANGNVYAYNYSGKTVCESTEWTACDISVHGHYPFRNLFEGNIVQEIDITDYWGPAGPGNVLLRNIVEQEGIEIMDASHGQIVLGNVILAGGPLTVASGITGTVLDGNAILPALAADADNCPVTDVPASLYLADAPTFYCSCTWPMLADGQLVNPAAQRALGIPTLPTPTPTPTPTPAGVAGTLAAINGLLLP